MTVVTEMTVMPELTVVAEMTAMRELTVMTVMRKLTEAAELAVVTVMPEVTVVTTMTVMTKPSCGTVVCKPAEVALVFELPPLAVSEAATTHPGWTALPIVWVTAPTVLAEARCVPRMITKGCRTGSTPSTTRTGARRAETGSTKSASGLEVGASRTGSTPSTTGAGTWRAETGSTKSAPGLEVGANRASHSIHHGGRDPEGRNRLHQIRPRPGSWSQPGRAATPSTTCTGTRRAETGSTKSAPGLEVGASRTESTPSTTCTGAPIAETASPWTA